MRGVQSIAATGVIHGIARMIGGQAVIGGVVDAAKTQGGAELIAFSGMVIHHVENDLDARRVQGLDHAFKFAHRMIGGRVARVGREIADRAITPVIAQAPVQQMALIHEVLDRQQLYRRHAQRLQIIDHRPAGQTGIGAAQVGRHFGMAHGETAHMQFVDQRVMPGRARRPVVAPDEGGVHHLTFGHSRRAVAGIKTEILVAAADPIAELGIAPLNLPDDAFA